MFLKAPAAGQTPGKKASEKRKHLSPEELRDNDGEYEPWLGHDEKGEVFCKLCRSMPAYADK